MTVSNLKAFTRGWIIGNFEPTLSSTENFEVAVKEYFEGESEKTHYHKIAEEFTVILSGVFKINEHIVEENEIVHLKPNEVSQFSCIKSGKTLVVKLPSVVNDKYLV